VELAQPNSTVVAGVVTTTDTVKTDGIVLAWVIKKKRTLELSGLYSTTENGAFVANTAIIQRGNFFVMARSKDDELQKLMSQFAELTGTWAKSVLHLKQMPKKKIGSVHHTKHGQPYKIMPNGRARFIKKTAATKKKKGGSVSVGGGLGSMLGRRADRMVSRAASTGRKLAGMHVKAAKKTARRANYALGGSVRKRE
jgi:hypothetical protein